MKKPNILLGLALLAGLLGAPGAGAAEKKPLPKELPPFGEDKPLPVPAIAKSTTPEGMTVWLIPRKGLPKVSAVLTVRGGTAVDPAAQVGISELLAETLKSGTATRSARQIAEELQAVGGTLSSAASDDALSLSADALSSGAEKAVAILADIARAASFPANEVELAKGNALQGLQVRSSTPEFMAQKAFASAIFGPHPYRIVAPDPAFLASATPEALKKEYARRFRPESALLVVVGDFSAASVGRAIEKAFGGWKGTGEPAPATPDVASPRPRDLVFVPRPGSVQSNLVVGQSGPRISDPDYVAALVANSVYGGGFASRLTENIREDKGYTYSPGGSVATYAKAGVVSTTAQVRNEVTAAALVEILYEMDRMGTTNVTPEELRGAQRFQAGLYLIRNQLQGAVANQLSSLWVKGMPPEFLGEFVPKVNAVTAADVREAGRKYFSSARQVVVVVGDDRVRDDLSQFGAVRTAKP